MSRGRDYKMTLGSHQKTIGVTQTWISPKWIIDAIGPFDHDPCAAFPRPWDCAARNTIEAMDGLSVEWQGRVWLNPPFHRYRVAEWVKRLAMHGCGTALLHARTEAEWFEPCWNNASGILFLADRIHFHYPNGRRAEANSGAPACLVAFGGVDLLRLDKSNIAGNLVTKWRSQFAGLRDGVGAAAPNLTASEGLAATQAATCRPANLLSDHRPPQNDPC